MIFGESVEKKNAKAAERAAEAARRARLTELTATAKRGLASYVETGTALEAIRTEELWRLAAPTWESWCRVELKMSERRVQQIIDASLMCSHLAGAGLPVPATERAARELGGMPVDDAVAAWQEATEEAGGEQPTSEQVAKAARKRKPKKAGRRPVAKPVSLKVPGAAVRVVPRKNGWTGLVAALEHALVLARQRELDADNGQQRAA
jgi:hypothetical protein